jgi:tRNA-Thr(GGU) m(6)t(6)A37 methyltransferase TsaA
MEVTYHAIGLIHTPFVDLRQMPIQPTGRAAASGTAEVFPEFAEGLKDLDGFSHIILIYHLHEVHRVDLTVTPFLGDAIRGVFATRAPTRPNPIGLSVVRLEGIEETTLHLSQLDVLDGTPLLDVKPYVPDFDTPRGDIRLGWLQAARGKVESEMSDERFIGRQTTDERRPKTEDRGPEVGSG